MNAPRSRQPGDVRVAILSGGISSEDYLSRRSAFVVERALNESGFRTEVLDWAKDDTVSLTEGAGGPTAESWTTLLDCFSSYRPDVIFNSLHGDLENAGQLQGFFELVGIPLTGHGIAPSVIGMDKSLTKEVFDRLSIRHPQTVELGHPDTLSAANAAALVAKSGMAFPIMLKSTHGGSSSGLSLIENQACLIDLWKGWGSDETVSRYQAYAEEFIAGDEYCVGAFGHCRSAGLTVFPVTKIEYEGEFFDKKTKFEDRYRVNCDHGLPDRLESEMGEWATSVHRSMRFVGFSRMDFRVQKGEVFALEVNTNPGLSPASILTNSLPCTDLSMAAAVAQLVWWALDPSHYDG